MHLNKPASIDGGGVGVEGYISGRGRVVLVCENVPQFSREHSFLWRHERACDDDSTGTLFHK